MGIKRDLDTLREVIQAQVTEPEKQSFLRQNDLIGRLAHWVGDSLPSLSIESYQSSGSELTYIDWCRCVVLNAATIKYNN